MSKRVVFVHNETLKRQRYLSHFGTRGYDVDSTTDRQYAKRQLKIGQADLAVIDADLGDSDQDGGFQLCRELRTHWPALPIILLGNQEDEADRLSAFRLGADEFLNEHTEPGYLAARSHALLARLELLRSESDINKDLCRGRLRIDHASQNAFWDGQIVDLKLAQLRMLTELAEFEGDACSLSQLMRAAQMQVQPNTVTATVSRMRKAFLTIDPGFTSIKNVHGHGYRWVDT